MITILNGHSGYYDDERKPESMFVGRSWNEKTGDRILLISIGDKEITIDASAARKLAQAAVWAGEPL
ncbi:hypothetical protein [Bradyrhizobium sp. BR 10289]|uniref:hypothetical protein n=1 Tax=Bradyrhizobium sp. BR 10289 TaxID=2749993 RepID=UPI001C649473|nr:hypothetical protein [Bradyrhizobium sp. BR 10289]MBW7970972.1 hypothetical protein [Bradyrhizobium sp. BR 10289]